MSEKQEEQKKEKEVTEYAAGGNFSTVKTDRRRENDGTGSDG